jgi:hypothetical protein
MAAFEGLQRTCLNTVLGPTNFPLLIFFFLVFALCFIEVNTNLLDGHRRTVRDLYRKEYRRNITVPGAFRHRRCHHNDSHGTGINELGHATGGACNHPFVITNEFGNEVTVLAPTADVPVVGTSVELICPGLLPIETEETNKTARVFRLPQGTEIPVGVEITLDLAKENHAIFSIQGQSAEVTFDHSIALDNFTICYVTAISGSRLPWALLGLMRARGELAPQWLRDVSKLKVLAVALDAVVNLSTDVDLMREALIMGETITKFNKEDIETVDFQQEVLAPLARIIEAFLNSGDSEPDEDIPLLDALSLLENLPMKRDLPVEVLEGKIRDLSNDVKRNSRMGPHTWDMQHNEQCAHLLCCLHEWHKLKGSSEARPDRSLDAYVPLLTHKPNGESGFKKIK